MDNIDGVDMLLLFRLAKVATQNDPAAHRALLTYAGSDAPRGKRGTASFALEVSGCGI
jgi:hypothetical protein